LKQTATMPSIFVSFHAFIGLILGLAVAPVLEQKMGTAERPFLILPVSELSAWFLT
jgi:hypothetical protein